MIKMSERNHAREVQKLVIERSCTIKYLTLGGGQLADLQEVKKLDSLVNVNKWKRW